MATYNRAACLRRAVGEVLAQTFTDFELIVVVDGSTDSTIADLSEMSDPRLRVVVQENGGPGLARNSGVATAHGDWLVFLDDDDRVAPDWLAVFEEHSHEPEVGVVCCGVTHVDDEGRDIGAAVPTPMGPLFGNVTAQFLAGTFAVRKVLFETAGAYDPLMCPSENFELGMRLGRLCQANAVAVAVDDRCPAGWTRHPGTPPSPSRVRALYAAAKRLLEKHAESLPTDRTVLHDTLAIAGINAVRLGHMSDARRYLGRAAMVRPGRDTSWLRLAGAVVPSLGRRVWGDYR